MASERNKFKISAMRAAVHSTTKSRITTVDHFFDIFDLRRSGMKSIFNFFVVVGKDFLQNVHITIMRDFETKRNPLFPSRLRGRGVEVSKTLFYALNLIVYFYSCAAGNSLNTWL